MIGEFYIDSNNEVQAWPSDGSGYDFPEPGQGIATYPKGLTEADFPQLFFDGVENFNVIFVTDSNNKLFYSNVVVSDSEVPVPMIVNGSFELGIDPGQFHNLPAGSTDIDGWFVSFGNIDYCGTVWQPSDGNRSLDLDGSSLQDLTGGIAQTFATQAGVRYLVKFDMAGNPAELPIIKPMRVSAAGQHADFFFDITGQSLFDMGWTEMEWNFIADDVFTTLEFRSLTVIPFTGWGPALDNVSVVLLLIGDVNCDGEINLLDVAPFVEAISGEYDVKADINQDGVVDLLDVAPFVDLLTGG